MAFPLDYTTDCSQQKTAPRIHQNVPFSTQKSKKFYGTGHSLLPIPLCQWGGENTKMKYSNQYNYRLLQSAKIIPKIYQNAPFSMQKSKHPLLTPIQ